MFFMCKNTLCCYIGLRQPEDTMTATDERRTWTPRRVDDPQPGWFMLRLVRGGPEVPAAIHREGGLWWVTIDGLRSEANTDPGWVPDLYRIWTGGREIAKSDFDGLTAARKSRFAPGARVRIDLNNMPSIF